MQFLLSVFKFYIQKLLDIIKENEKAYYHQRRHNAV